MHGPMKVKFNIIFFQFISLQQSDFFLVKARTFFNSVYTVY